MGAIWLGLNLKPRIREGLWPGLGPLLPLCSTADWGFNTVLSYFINYHSIFLYINIPVICYQLSHPSITIIYILKYINYKLVLFIFKIG